uniref:Uncharacterized protein n=1 Tax=Opuntia streptacantha TaxID=393608 RepID=A0A7C8ZHK0_OPUST
MVFGPILVSRMAVMTPFSSPPFTFFSCPSSFLIFLCFPHFLCFFESLFFMLSIGKYFVDNLSCVFRIIAYQNVVKYCSGLHLPDFYTNVLDRLHDIEIRIIFKLWIVNPRRLPLSLVVRVLNFLWLPWSFVCWIWYLGSFP